MSNNYQNCTIPFVRPVYSSILHDDHDNGNGFSPSRRINNEVTLLLSQKKLESLGDDTAIQVVKDLTSTRLSDDLENGLSDKERLELVKSRHTQSASELSNYAKSLFRANERVNNSYNRVKEFLEFENQLNSDKDE